MIKQLPEWYKITSVNLPETDILEKNSEAVLDIVKTGKLDFLLNCVRQYLNLPIEDTNFISQLYEIFLKFNNLFAQKNNHLELRVLCGAIIHEYIIFDKAKDKYKIAYSLLSGLFEQDKKSLINVEIIEQINNFINETSINIREKVIELKQIAVISNLKEDVNNQESLKSNFDNIVSYFKSISKNITDNNNLLNSKLKIIEEESNIHWWIFRGFSNIFNIPFSKLKINSAPIIIGKELSDLINIIPGPIAYVQFLEKIINDNLPIKDKAFDKNIIFKNVINDIEIELKKELSENFTNSKLGNLCPIMISFQKSIDSGDKKGWLSSFKNSTNLDANKKIDIYKLAIQSYIENILMKYFK